METTPTAMYLVVDASSINGLQNTVRHNISEGYECQGGVAVVEFRGELRWFQAMQVKAQPLMAVKPVELTPTPAQAAAFLETVKRKPGRPKRVEVE